MVLPKDRLRKIHGIAEPLGSADPSVLARRKYHEMVSTWLANKSYILQLLFVTIGFVNVLLPALSRPWRTVIENTFISREIFHDYSTFSGLAIANLYILIALFLIRTLQIKSLPGGSAFALSYRNIIDMELFPRTPKEELAYWSEIVFGLAGTTTWLFIPFGVLAYFIKISRVLG